MFFNAITELLPGFWGPTAIVFSFILLISYPIFFPGQKGRIRELKGISIISAWQFFNHRHDFMISNFANTTKPHFRFKILQHSVVAVRGESSRKEFFDNKTLNFEEGYKILMGGIPQLEDIDLPVDKSENDIPWFRKMLSILISKDRLNNILPSLFEDINRRMVSWGKEGTMDPFKDIYDLVFQMTVRLALCKEASDDLASVTHLQNLYWQIEKSSTPTVLLLPWFPSRAKKIQKAAIQELFDLILKFISKRKDASVTSDDAINMLLGEGQSDHEIVSIVMSILFAGVINTGLNSCWALLYLAFNQQWKSKVKAEVEALVAKHTDTTSSEPLHKRLSAIPSDVWQEEMPVLESVIKETLRISVNGTFLRRNVLNDLNIAGGTISRGDFIAYHARDVHSNPNIYSNPSTWDPDRFSPDRDEGKKEVHDFIAWGAGRHPCAGMKAAKLEMKIIIALFIAGYDFEVVDGSGKYPKSIPKVDYNNILATRPAGEPCFLKFKRVVQ